jgi:hypothetical protein
MKKVLIVLLALTLYCNIGWTVGSYYYNNVLATSPEKLTTLGKAAAGGWSALADKRLRNSDSNKFAAVLIFGILWPFGLAVVAVLWIIYYVYYVGWFIFAGGGAKLLGLV